MKRECGGKCGGVADNRTTNLNGAFVSMKSGLTLCSVEWRERGRGSSQMAESNTEDGWNEGCTGRRSYASFHLAPDPKPKISMPRVLFRLFYPPPFFPFFTLFAQLQIEIPPTRVVDAWAYQTEDDSVQRPSIPNNSTSRFCFAPLPNRREERKIFSVARYDRDPPHFRGYTIFFFLFRASARPVERKSSRVWPNVLSALYSLSLSLFRTNNRVTGRFFPAFAVCISTLFEDLSRTRRSLHWRKIKQRNKASLNNARWY